MPLLPKIARALESHYNKPIPTSYGRAVLADDPIFYWRLEDLPQRDGHPMLVWNRALSQEEIEAHYEAALEIISSASS